MLSRSCVHVKIHPKNVFVFRNKNRLSTKIRITFRDADDDYKYYENTFCSTGYVWSLAVLAYELIYGVRSASKFLEGNP